MINYIRVSSPEELEPRMKALATRIGAFWDWTGGDLLLEFSRYQDPRTRSQNSLYWMWLNQMAEYYSRPEKPFNKEDMHDLMRHHFLGYTNKTIGNTAINQQLVSTTDLKKAQMSEYMHKIEQWNTDNGLLVKIPADNEYMKYKEARI